MELHSFAFSLTVVGCNITCQSNDTTCHFELKDVHNSTNCTWTLYRHNGSVTTLFFKNMVLNENDLVKVYDGPITPSNLVASFNSPKDPFVGVMFQNITTIFLVLGKKDVDAPTLRVDFKISDDCQMEFDSKFLTQIMSPVYHPARGHVHCTYKLNGTGDGSNVLALSFTKFAVSDGYVTVNGTNHTGSSLPSDYISNTNDSVIEIDIIFRNSSQKNSFEAFYTFVSKVSSKKQLGKDTHKVIRQNEIISPLEEYRFIFENKNNGTTTIKVNISEITVTPGTVNVIVTDGGSISSRVLLDTEHHTSSIKDKLVITSGRMVTIQIINGYKLSHINYSIILESEADGTHLFNKGTVTLKNRAKTPPTVYYHFSSPVDQQAQVTVNPVAKNTLLYPTASISFYDGLQLDSPFLVKFKIPNKTELRTSTPFFPVIASGNSLLMVAENFSGAQNFTANFISIPKGCNVTASGAKGSYSLNYNVVQGQLCQWTIPFQAKGEETIIISPQTLTFEDNQTVTIYSGILDNIQSLKIFTRNCSKELLPQITVQASKGAEVIFRSENTCRVNCTKPVVSLDFTVKAKDSLCGKSFLKSSSGSLTSPNFPRMYPLNAQCTWQTHSVAANMTKLLYLQFSTFKLSKGHKFEIRNKKKKILASFTGTTLPKDVLLPASLLSLKFSADPGNHSQWSEVDQGFSAKYTVLDCGGRYTNRSDKISSPTNSSGTCVWIITLPLTSNKGSLRNIIQFSVTSNKKNIRGLEFHDGASASDPLLTVKLTKGHSKKILSRNNTLFVKYTPQPSTKVNFQVTYSTYSCNKTTQCDSGMCIHPDWRCDGHVQCKDGKDELNCNGTSTVTTKGVKVFWIPLCLIFGVIIGLTIVFVVFQVRRRLKHHNYRLFSNTDDVVNS